MKRAGGGQTVRMGRLLSRVAAAAVVLALGGCHGNTADLGGEPPGREGGAAGGDGGGTTIASAIQVPPRYLASDGTSLFWVTLSAGDPLSSMPVGGGAIQTAVAAGQAGGGFGPFLTVDDANIYFLGN
jgi:hypothetical protein